MTGDKARVDSPIEELFDLLYLRFWEGELEGERLARDVALARELAALPPSGRVLDLACGFGRLTTELARAGLRVVGLDRSPDMLCEGSRRAAAEDTGPGPAPRFVRGDMRDELGGPFDAVLLWFTSFGYFGDEQDQLVLCRAREALAPGGRLLIETRHWDRMAREFDPTTLRSHGDDWMIEHHRYDPETGVQETAQTLVVDGERIERTSSVRRYGFPELRQKCLSAGFAQVQGFDEHGERLSQDSKRCIVVAWKGEGT